MFSCFLGMVGWSLGLGRFGTRSCTRVFGWAVGMDGLPGCCPNCRCVAGFGWLARKSAVPARFRCAPSRSRASPYGKRQMENSLCASTTKFSIRLIPHCSLPAWILYHIPPKASTLCVRRFSTFPDLVCFRVCFLLLDIPGAGRLIGWRCGRGGCG